ncbi:hypothetical protein E0494_08250 [Marinilabiliaceae bacterium JC040]|nr:hypothetical protein [Marinilabiliaceae bacterium JC040]
MKDFRKEFIEKLKPLYSDLIDNYSKKGDSVFSVQWGEKFPKTNNSGIMFVGKCLNGSDNGSLNLNVLFGNTKNSLVSKKEQLRWVVECEGNTEGYNTNKSAFWRLIKNISQEIYHTNEEEWYRKIAWNNLYKLSPKKGGNTSESTKSLQFETCAKILKKEISIMSPKYVIFFTSDWEDDFLTYLNNGEKLKYIDKASWGEYKTKVCKIKSKYYIISKHPQCKDEFKHSRAITKLINKIEDID